MANKGEQAEKFFDALEKYDEHKFAEMLQTNVDHTLIPIFAEYAKGIFSEVDEEVLSGLVHLMVMAYLVKTNEVAPLTATE